MNEQLPSSLRLRSDQSLDLQDIPSVHQYALRVCIPSEFDKARAWTYGSYRHVYSILDLEASYSFSLSCICMYIQYPVSKKNTHNVTVKVMPPNQSTQACNPKARVSGKVSINNKLLQTVIMIYKVFLYFCNLYRQA